MPILIGRLDELIEDILELDTEPPEYSDHDLANFFCIQIKPFKCRGCRKMLCYACVGPDHVIIVFPDKDDENLIVMMQTLQGDEYDPYVVKYSQLYGPCITLEDAADRGWIERT